MSKLVKSLLIDAACMVVLAAVCLLIGYMFVEYSLPAMGFK